MITNNSSNLSVTDVNDKEIKIRSLKNSYNFIIKIDLVKDTVECIHKNIARPVGISYDVVLTIESARNYFLNNYVFSDDYEIVETFFQKIVNLKTLENLNDCDEPIQAVCSFRFDDETIRKYSAVVVVLDLSNVLLCGKDITDVVYSQELISKSNILEKIRTYLNAVFDNYHIQVITFEILNRKVYPIFFGKKMCDIMSISEKEFRFISEKGITLEEFIARMGLNEYDFSKMLKGKNVEVSLIEIDGSQAIYNARAFFSHNQGSMFTIIFSKENINTFISQLIEENYTEESIEDVDNTENGMFIPGKNSRIWIRTFGSFDIFVNGVPIRFSSAKSKELLAVLVDRRGGSLSAEEAIAYLWEDKPADKQVMTNYRKVAMRMQETLNNYGIGDLVINNKGLRSLNMAIVDCDLYRFILKDKTYTHFFHGQYMQNYSWAENTLATLYQIAGDLDLEDKKGWIETQIF